MGSAFTQVTTFTLLPTGEPLFDFVGSDGIDEPGTEILGEFAYLAVVLTYSPLPIVTNMLSTLQEFFENIVDVFIGVLRTVTETDFHDLLQSKTCPLNELVTSRWDWVQGAGILIFATAADGTAYPAQRVAGDHGSLNEMTIRQVSWRDR